MHKYIYSVILGIALCLSWQACLVRAAESLPEIEQGSQTSAQVVRAEFDQTHFTMNKEATVYSFLLIVPNTGTYNATDVTVTIHSFDTIELQLENQDSILPVELIDNSENDFSWQIPSIAVGEQVALQVYFTARSEPRLTIVITSQFSPPVTLGEDLLSSNEVLSVTLLSNDGWRKLLSESTTWFSETISLAVHSASTLLTTIVNWLSNFGKL